MRSSRTARPLWRSLSAGEKIPRTTSVLANKPTASPQPVESVRVLWGNSAGLFLLAPGAVQLDQSLSTICSFAPSLDRRLVPEQIEVSMQ